MTNSEVLTKRPTVAFSEDEYREIKLHCVANDITIQKFVRSSVMFCLKEGIDAEN